MARSIDDVSHMLVQAKQNDEDVHLLTQIFYYPSEIKCSENKENFKLMQIDEELIKKLESGERLIFKGSNDEKVVLCTENETYEVKEGEISNSLLVCPNLLFGSDVKNSEKNERTLTEQKIFGVQHSYLEFRPTFPRFGKLKSILSQANYSGPDNDEESHKGFYFCELLDNVQCSRSELLAQLEEIKAIKLEDKWRLLSLDYLVEIFSHLMSEMEKNNWTKIHVLECKKNLDLFVPDVILEHVFKHYSKNYVKDQIWLELDEYLISRCFAQVLLQTAEGKFSFDEFIMAWENCLSPVIKPNLNYLKGLALIDNESELNKVIHLFLEEDLPENIPERFRLLFKNKEKWTLEEITPYIQKLTTKTANVNSLLTKFARCTNVKGLKVFTAKYAK
ncbi:Sister chromatid cohesion protein dcc1, putative [Pediculus humanus corporis]|uniref:Sister chromatid cohesion protein DCC1 n=1 Tax=Pediculus humanus subsp. corporis TaxID=121224 RepID=E0W0W8_PEDHC|nr:Sister chromatid cohesion protein dcc1, putative [Pediculus humanus corporis]EEB19274.1 Sister chromatid cohesion protein dcc1, putative [Pediculus humanus corporis]